MGLKRQVFVWRLRGLVLCPEGQRISASLPPSLPCSPLKTDFKSPREPFPCNGISLPTKLSHWLEMGKGREAEGRGALFQCVFPTPHVNQPLPSFGPGRWSHRGLPVWPSVPRWPMASTVPLFLPWPGLKTCLVLEPLALGHKAPVQFHQSPSPSRERRLGILRGQRRKERRPHPPQSLGGICCLCRQLIDPLF